MNETQWMLNGVVMPDSYRPSRRTVDLLELGDRAVAYLRMENNRRGRYVA